MYSFGDGRNGQLGVRVRQQSATLSTPSVVPINCPSKIVHVDCGAVHTAALSGMYFCYLILCGTMKNHHVRFGWSMKLKKLYAQYLNRL